MLRRRNGVQSLRSMFNDGETASTKLPHDTTVDLTYFTCRLATSINNTQSRIARQQSKQVKAYSHDLEPISFYGLQRRSAIRVPAGKERPWIFQSHRQEQEELLAKHKLHLCDEKSCMYCVLASYQSVLVQGPRDVNVSTVFAKASSVEESTSENSDCETTVTAMSNRKCMLSAKVSVVGICIGVTERIEFWESQEKS
ncbi:hypothetical protein AC579_9018 [Pseudocercospora musae]|uniref:Uncharacterized protein n=1 Tax=Pseudocercospora musae TaxID=113226 RepID=A0A139ISI4_9PEZI|nr:hypothetical protein AC579_9018 [Pseudocercospora musae]